MEFTPCIEFVKFDHCYQVQQRRLVQDLLVQDRDGVVREVEVREERRFQNRNGHDSGSGHVQTSNGLWLVEDVLDGLFGQGVEAEVDLLDVDEDVCVGRNVCDLIVRDGL